MTKMILVEDTCYNCPYLDLDPRDRQIAFCRKLIERISVTVMSTIPIPDNCPLKTIGDT